MNVNSALQTGLQGVQRGQEGLVQAANEIVQNTTDDSVDGGNIVEPIMDLKLYEQTVKASLQVVKSADEALGTLLDTMAQEVVSNTVANIVWR